MARFPELPPCFRLELEVRDYELDRFGVVNNAVYQNYLEHARHQYLQSRGINLDSLYQQGYTPVVTQAEIAYRNSLQSGDRFVVTLAVETLSRIKFVFLQTLVRGRPPHPIVWSRISGTVLNASGRPEFPPDFQLLHADLTLNT